MATYLLLGYAIGAGALLPRTPCERTVCNYVGARNLFVLYRDWHILSGSFCPQVVADASTYAGQTTLRMYASVFAYCVLRCVHGTILLATNPARMLGCIQ